MQVHPEAFRALSGEINEVVEELQTRVDTDFQEKVEQLLPTLTIFGYPGLQDPNLSASTELNVKSLLESNTKVYYQKDDHFTLPETYNGLVLEISSLFSFVFMNISELIKLKRLRRNLTSSLSKSLKRIYILKCRKFYSTAG